MEMCRTMSSKRLLAAAAVLSLFVTGCSIGFTNLRPGENSIFYTSLFHDIINTYDELHWLWVRGTIALDYNGDGKVEEEAVIATIQQGTERRPGPIESAYLLICRIGPNNERTTLARTLLFDSNPMLDAPRPVNDLGLVRDTPLTRARAQVVEDKVSFKESVVVYFAGDESPGSVWYAGFRYENGKLTKMFDTAMWQSTPGMLVANLDKTPAASPYGYQLIFGVSAIPPRIVNELDALHDTPVWGHVYARDAEGMYKQADARFGQHYRQIENGWNQLYLKALFHGLPPADLAWFEYHLALINHYTGNADMAARLLEKAGKGAEDEELKHGIEQAMLLLNGRDTTAWSITPEGNTAVATATASDSPPSK